MGKRIIEVRETKNITQEKLQELTGFDIKQIGRIERAETIFLVSSIKLIADQLKISVFELLDFPKLKKR